MSFARAHIEVLDASVRADFGREGKLEVQYNPETLRYSKGAQIAEIGLYGLDAPILQWIRGQAETLSIELFFDRTEDGLGDDAKDVRELTDPFARLLRRQRAIHASPRVRFSWGPTDRSFTGVVERVDQAFDLFAHNGIPVRATVTLALKEYRTLEEQLAEPAVGRERVSQVTTVQPGERLPDVAERAYGDPAAWREIAAANPGAIRDPLRPPAGASLRLPPRPRTGGAR